MNRRLLNLLTALSLLLCVAVLALWVRGRNVRDTLTWEWTNMYNASDEPYLYREVRTVTAARGGLRLYRERIELNSFAGRPWSPSGFTRTATEFIGSYPVWRGNRSPGTWLDYSGAGFELIAAAQGQKPRPEDRWRQWWSEWSVTAPLWFLVLVTSLPAIGQAAAIAVRRRRRRSAARGFPVNAAEPTP